MSSRPFLVCLLAIALPVPVLSAFEFVPGAPGPTRLGLPLHFEANSGQAGSEVKFVAQGPEVQLMLSDTESTISLRSPNEVHSSSTVFRVRLLGTDASASIQGEDRLRGTVNYVRGRDPAQWRMGVASFSKIRYSKIYAGIDLVYYGRQGQIEYDFVVQPGAEPRVIRFTFDGVDSLELTPAGDLQLRVGRTEIKQRRPILYQEIDGHRREIGGGFVRYGAREIGFTVDEYDCGRPLIIDPVLEYGTYFGGPLRDRGLGIAVDKEGNAIVCGESSGAFPTTNAVQTTFGGGRFPDLYYGDAVVAKFNSNATQLIYATYLGGSGDDRAYSVAVDAEGYAYVVGETSSANFPVKNALVSQGTGAFLARLSPNGQLEYATYLNPDGATAIGVALDSAANVYITGSTQSTNFPTMRPYQGTNAGGADAFVLKLDKHASAILFSTYFGGILNDVGNDIAVSATGSFVIAGQTSSEDTPSTTDRNEGLPLLNAIQPKKGGFLDAFVAKFDASGQLLFSTYLGGANDDRAFSVAFDPALNIYVGGETFSLNFPLKNPFQDTLTRGVGGFVAKIDLSGSLVYSTYLGVSGFDRVFGVAADLGGCAFVTGTVSPPFPQVDGLWQAQGSLDGYVAIMGPNGGTNLQFSTYVGSSASDAGRAIAVTETGDIYVTGEVRAAGFPTTNNSQPAGREDGFVLKLAQSQLRLIAIEVNQAIQDWDNSVALVKDKTTFVRAHIEYTGPGASASITPLLRGYRNGAELPESPVHCLNPGGHLVAKRNAAARRNEYDASANFLVPSVWTQGTLQLKVDAPGLGCFEVQGLSGDCSWTGEFHEMPKPKVALIGVKWRTSGNTTNTPTIAQMDDLLARMTACYPVAAFDAELSLANFQVNVASGQTYEQVISAMVNQVLPQFLQQQLTFFPERLYFGALPTAGTIVQGLASSARTHASAFFSTQPGDLSRHAHSHEIAHLLGRRHSTSFDLFGACTINGFPLPDSKTGRCGECTGISDPDYPLFQPLLGTTLPLLGPMHSGEYAVIAGVDSGPAPVAVNAFSSLQYFSVVDPTNIYDMMSYCIRRGLAFWPSVYTYEGLRSAITNRFSFSAPSLQTVTATAQPYLFVRGTVDLSSGAVQYLPFFRLTTKTVVRPAAGDYLLRALDANRQVLQELTFGPVKGEPLGVDPLQGYFLLPLADNPAIREVEIVRAGNVLATRKASAARPQVKLLSPNGGEVVDASAVQIRWEGSDADGDNLNFDLFYSADGGSTWTTLLVDGTGTEHEAPVDGLRGSSNALFRVVAKDGFFTTADDSDRALVLRERPPTVAIRSPAPLSVLSGQQTIMFQASAWDTKDGPLRGTNLTWTSSRDGVIGSGDILLKTAATLTPGAHTITATAIDTDRNRGTNSIQIFVGALTSPQITSIKLTAAKEILITLEGEPGTRVKVESSTDLKSWTQATTGTLAGDALSLTLPWSSAERQRFYRALAVP